jgi:hypothetical protein
VADLDSGEMVSIDDKNLIIQINKG